MFGKDMRTRCQTQHCVGLQIYIFADEFSTSACFSVHYLYNFDPNKDINLAVIGR